jgi:hypothetical protein
MKTILLLSNADISSPAIRYRLIYTLNLLKEEEKVKYDYLHFYSNKSTKAMDSGRQLQKLIYILIDLLNFIWKIIFLRKKYDVIIVKSYIFPFLGRFPEEVVFKSLKCKRLIYDIDDAIYLNKTRSQNKLFGKFRDASSKVKFWAMRAEKITISNKIIQNDLINLYNTDKSKFIEFLSSPYRNQYFSNEDELETAKDYEEIRFIWLGSPHTQNNLILCENFIRRLPSLIRNTKVYIIGVSKDFSMFNGLKHVEYIDWNPKNEEKYMKASHYGLNPLKSDEFELRKSAFKVIQYYRAGIIPIVSDVGINKDLIDTFGGYCTDDFNESKLEQYLMETLSEFKGISKKMYNHTDTLSVEVNKEKVENAIFE